MRPRQIPCEVWSRVVGYLRPTRGWNVAKKLEFKQRKTYRLDRTEGATARGSNSGMGTGCGMTQGTADEWAANDPAAWAEVELTGVTNCDGIGNAT